MTDRDNREVVTETLTSPEPPAPTRPRRPWLPWVVAAVIVVLVAGAATAVVVTRDSNDAPGALEHPTARRDAGGVCAMAYELCG